MSALAWNPEVRVNHTRGYFALLSEFKSSDSSTRITEWRGVGGLLRELFVEENPVAS